LLLPLPLLSVQVLQLDMLGSKRIASWQPHEELLFCLGM
jgi:hypothetical protein